MSIRKYRMQSQLTPRPAAPGRWTCTRHGKGAGHGARRWTWLLGSSGERGSRVLRTWGETTDAQTLGLSGRAGEGSESRLGIRGYTARGVARREDVRRPGLGRSRRKPAPGPAPEAQSAGGCAPELGRSFFQIVSCGTQRAFKKDEGSVLHINAFPKSRCSAFS